MHELLLGTGFGFFAGIIGILIGGWIGSKKRRQPYLCGAGETEGKTKYKRYDMFAEFAAGLLLAVICFDLLPAAFLLGGVLRSLPGIFLGLLFLLLFRNHLQMIKRKKEAVSRCFWLETSLFCIPVGLALGASCRMDGKLAAVVTLAIAVSSIPEGIRFLGEDAMPVEQKIGIAAAYSLLIAFGSFAGILLSFGSCEGIALLFSLSSGVLLYLCAEILFREDGASGGRIPMLFHLLGILLGLFLAV